LAPRTPPPTAAPSALPTSAPTLAPTTAAPTLAPTTAAPTRAPSALPSAAPTRQPTASSVTYLILGGDVAGYDAPRLARIRADLAGVAGLGAFDVAVSLLAGDAAAPGFCVAAHPIRPAAPARCHQGWLGIDPFISAASAAMGRRHFPFLRVSGAGSVILAATMPADAADGVYRQIRTALRQCSSLRTRAHTHARRHT
jgi:hypothetical protein